MPRVSDTAGAARLGVLDDTGAVIYPDSLPMTGATYDVDGNPLTMTKTDGTDSWVMTFTWDGSGNLLTQSVWERQ